jgi:hypothetical protein
MDGKRVTADEILAEIGFDVEQMAQKVADAINNAQVGAICACQAFAGPLKNF